MTVSMKDRRSSAKAGSRTGLATVLLGLAIVAMGLTACSAGAAPPGSTAEQGVEQQGGLMVPPNPPGVWYAGDFVSLDEAAAKVPCVILMPDEAVVGAELLSVELNHPEAAVGVALHYANGVVVNQIYNQGIESLNKTLRPYELAVEVNGVPAIGQEAGFSESQITGGRIPYPSAVMWYIGGVLRVVTYADRDSDIPLEELRRIAESMKPTMPAQP